MNCFYTKNICAMDVIFTDLKNALKTELQEYVLKKD